MTRWSGHQQRGLETHDDKDEKMDQDKEDEEEDETDRRYLVYGKPELTHTAPRWHCDHKSHIYPALEDLDGRSLCVKHKRQKTRVSSPFVPWN
jgi:hypothetical protein